MIDYNKFSTFLYSPEFINIISVSSASILIISLIFSLTTIIKKFHFVNIEQLFSSFNQKFLDIENIIDVRFDDLDEKMDNMIKLVKDVQESDNEDYELNMRPNLLNEEELQQILPPDTQSE